MTSSLGRSRRGLKFPALGAPPTALGSYLGSQNRTAGAAELKTPNFQKLTGEAVCSAREERTRRLAQETDRVAIGLHAPIKGTGAWLRSVLLGHLYYGVPGNH